MERQEVTTFVRSYCGQKIEPLEELLEKKTNETNERIKWIIDKNLKVPGLIGAPSEEGAEPKYENLASYLASSSAETS